MSFLRPAAVATLTRWSEVLLTGAIGTFGLWVAFRGGWFFAGLGAVIVALACAFGLIAVRRLQFSLAVDAPGVVEVLESRVGYMGPAMGGYMALPDLVEVQVLDVAGRRRCWRLKSVTGEAMVIPFAAEGAAALYDALAQLPGISPAKLAGAARVAAIEPVTLWRRGLPGA